MDTIFIHPDEYSKIVKAADKGGWAERAVTVLDTELNKSKCLFGDGGYIVVDDNYDITVLYVNSEGFVFKVEA